MAALLIGNVDSSASDEEIRDLLVRYGDAPAMVLRTLQPRLQDMYWKNRKLNVSVLELRQDGGAPQP